MLFYKKNVEIFSHTPTFIIEPTFKAYGFESFSTIKNTANPIVRRRIIPVRSLVLVLISPFLPFVFDEGR